MGTLGFIFSVLLVFSILFFSLCAIISITDYLKYKHRFNTANILMNSEDFIRKNVSKALKEKENEPVNIDIKYFSNNIDKIAFTKDDKGDWIDLRSAKDIVYKKGERVLIPLGIGMKLPQGYESNVVTRSSTLKNTKLIQANPYAVIDNSYSGDNDQWFFQGYAVDDGSVKENDRICQFRINKRMTRNIKFNEVEHLRDTDRNGFGSTGVK